MASNARDRILSRLIGFGGAVQTGFKTELTDSTVVMALAHLDTEVEVEADEILKKLEEEKFMVSPNCAHCQHPCGNTSDYDMKNFYQATVEIQMIKEEIIAQLLRIGKSLQAQGIKGELPEEIYKALSFLGYDLGMDSYANLLVQLEELN